MIGRLAMIAATGEAVRCDGCRHWTPPGSEVSVASRHINFEGYGECDLTQVEGGAGNTESAALAYDEDARFAILATKADFGCVLFMAKEKSDG